MTTLDRAATPGALALALLLVSCSVDGTPDYPRDTQRCFLRCNSIVDCTAAAATACGELGNAESCEAGHGCEWAALAYSAGRPPTVHVLGDDSEMQECLGRWGFFVCRERTP